MEGSTQQQQQKMCPKCGLVQIYDYAVAASAFGKSLGFGRRKRTDKDVYRGICLLCHTLMEAKLMLNEPLTDFDWMSANPDVRNAARVNQIEDENSDANVAVPPMIRMSDISDMTENTNSARVIPDARNESEGNPGLGGRISLEDIQEEWSNDDAYFNSYQNQQISSDENLDHNIRDETVGNGNGNGTIVDLNIQRDGQNRSSATVALTNTLMKLVLDETVDNGNGDVDPNTQRDGQNQSRSDIGTVTTTQEFNGRVNSEKKETIFAKKKSGEYDHNSTTSDKRHCSQNSDSSVTFTPGAFQVESGESDTIFARKKSGAYDNDTNDRALSMESVSQNACQSSQNLESVNFTPGAFLAEAGKVDSIFAKKMSGEYDNRSSLNSPHRQLASENPSQVQTLSTESFPQNKRQSNENSESGTFTFIQGAFPQDAWKKDSILAKKMSGEYDNISSPKSNNCDPCSRKLMIEDLRHDQTLSSIMAQNARPGRRSESSVTFTPRTFDSILAKKMSGEYDDNDTTNSWRSLNNRDDPHRRQRQHSAPGNLGQTLDDAKPANTVDFAPGTCTINKDSLLARKLSGSRDDNDNSSSLNRGLVQDSSPECVSPVRLSSDESSKDNDLALVNNENGSRSSSSISVGDCDSCCELLEIILKQIYSSDVVMQALEKFRDLLPDQHATLDRKWPKVLSAVMRSHASNANVLSDVLDTLRFAIVLSYSYSHSHSYISDIVLVDMGYLYAMIGMHGDDGSVQEHFCSLIAGIAAIQEHAHHLLRLCDGEVIVLLVEALQCPSSEGKVQENALKALFQLSSASLSSDYPLEFVALLSAVDGSTDAGDSLRKAVETIIQAMQYGENRPLQIHGACLLWNIFESDTAFSMKWGDVLLGRLLQHTVRVKPYINNSEAIICLLSKMSCYGSSSLGTQAFPLVVVETMQNMSSSPVVALHGCKCLKNMCLRAPSILLSQTMVAACNGIDAIISCMDTFPEHACIQSEACAAIYAISNNCRQNKERVWQLGGIDKIVNAFDCYSNGEQGTASKIQVCKAVGILCMDSPARLTGDQNKGVLVKFAQEDAKVSINGDLRCAIQDLLAHETCEFLRDSLQADEKQFTSEEGMPCSLQRKAFIAMRRFPKCASLQEIGCHILASPSDVLDVSRKEMLEAIALSLKEHNLNPENVVASCVALQKLCTMQLTPRSFDAILFRSFIEVTNSIALHQEDVASLEHASGALSSLCTLRSGLASVSGTGHIINMIAKAMNRFPESSTFRKCGIDIIGAVFSISENTVTLFTDEVVTAVARYIEEADEEKEVHTAIKIIHSLSETGFQALAILLGDGNVIDAILGYRYKWPEALPIQRGVVDILSNVTLHSENGTCDSLHANLRLITTSDVNPNIISHSRSEAVQAMQRYPKNADIHEHACKLLACSYALVSEYKSVATTSEDFESITISLTSHMNNPANAAAACSALQNLCVMISQSDSGIDHCSSSFLSQLVVEAANVITLYPEDQLNLDLATGALQALCAMEDGLALVFEFDETIRNIIKAMNRFPTSIILQRHGIEILWSFFSVSENGMGFVTDELVTAIVRFIESSDEETESDSAVNILRYLSNKGFKAVEILYMNETLIDSIVGCMFRWPTSLSIQTAAACILSNIALNPSQRAEICNKGGTSRIISALGTALRQDPTFTCQALLALTNLTSDADVEILSSPDAPAPELIMRAMETHPQNLSVQINGASVLWVLSARNEIFRDGIIHLGGAEAVAQAMSRFVGSEQMQEKGSVAIWSLAVAGPSETHQYEVRKSRVGRCAIKPTVCGLSAHLSCGRLVENALGCLKCLSTIPANKELLEDNDAVNLIYSCLWLYYENPRICKEALAVLCNVTSNVVTNEVVEIRDGDLQVIALAMSTHPSVKCVQTNAIKLLRNSTFSQTNGMVFGQNPYLADLVRSAKSNFNDDIELGVRADDVLCVL